MFWLRTYSQVKGISPKVKISKKNQHFKQKTKQEKDKYNKPSHHRYRGNIKLLNRSADVDTNSKFITRSLFGRRNFAAESRAKNAQVKTLDEMTDEERRIHSEYLKERYSGVPIQNNSGFPYVLSKPKAKPVASIKSVAPAKMQKVSEKDQTSEAKIISNVGTTLEKELQELDKLEHTLDNMFFVKTAKNSTLEESIEASKLEQEIQRKKEETEKKRIEELNSPEKVAKIAETLCKNKKKENRCSDSVSPNSQRHIQSLKKISAALKKLSDPNTDQKWYEQYQDRVYDVSNIDPNILHALDFDFYEEKLFNSTEPQHEMMKTVLLHTEGIEAYLAKYSEKESIQRLTNENIEHLKEAIECIKADRLGEALIALEKSWAYQDLISDACFGYDCINRSKAFSKGLYSGVKRAINIPQRVVDLYHTGKALGKVFSRFAEIDELVHIGEMKEAEAKYEALKKDIVAVWENLKERISNASGDDIAFFIGEVIGDILTTKGLHKGLQHLLKVVKPKVAKGMKTCGQKLEELVEKVKKNPGKATTVEGYIEVEFGKKSTKNVVGTGLKKAEMPVEVQGRMWFANAAKEETVRNYQELASLLRRGKIFERVHDLDCREIFKLYGDKLGIKNSELFEALKEMNIDLDKIIWDNNSLKHIFGIEKKAGGKWGGWHVDYNLDGVKVAAVEIEKIAIHSETGVIVLKCIGNNQRVIYKSIFPPIIAKESAFKEIVGSFSKKLVKIEKQGSRIVFDCLSENGITIRTVVESNGRMVTSFPFLEKACKENLNYVDVVEFLENFEK